MRVVEHTYAPRGVCRDLFRCRDGEVLLAGPAGTGKSRACLEKLYLAALKYPNMRGIIIRKTLESLGSTALETWRKFIIPEAVATGNVFFYGGSKEEPAQYRFKNGSRVFICGMDKETRIMSSEYDIAYIQEAIELGETDWQNINSRLRNGIMPYQQIIADANPDMPTHWLKKRCDAGLTTMLHCKHTDNPVLFHPDGTMTERGAAYMARLDALTGVRYKRLKLGLWVAAEGMVYEEVWDESRHVVDRFDIPDSWTRYWSVDFGFIHPFVLQCWAEDPDGKLWMYREIYYTRRTVTEHTKHIMSIVCPGGEWKHDDGGNEYYDGGEWIEPRPSAVICDHDAENRETFERLIGFGTEPADKAVLSGIEAVSERFSHDRIAYLRDSTVEIDTRQAEVSKPVRTVDEVPGYRWDLGGGRKVREEVVKVDDDGMDTTRYMVTYRDGTRGVGIRWL